MSTKTSCGFTQGQRRESAPLDRHRRIFITHPTAVAALVVEAPGRVGVQQPNYLLVTPRVTVASASTLNTRQQELRLLFGAMALLGGKNSFLFGQQTLHGYGAGRFVDNNLTVLSRSRILCARRSARSISSSRWLAPIWLVAILGRSVCSKEQPQIGEEGRDAG